MIRSLESWWAAARWPTTTRQLGLDTRLRLFHCHDIRGGVSLAVRLGSGHTCDDVARQAERICSIFRCARVEVQRDDLRGDHARVILRWTASPPSEHLLKYRRPCKDIVPPRAVKAVPLGLDLDGAVVSLPLFSAIAGGSSLLIGGVPGSGKTTALRVVLAGLSQTEASIVVIDPTGGAEAGWWRSRLSDAVLDAEPEPTAELLRRILVIIERRGRILACGAHPSSLTPLVVVCDELAELAGAGTSKQQDEVRNLLRRVVALGRKANVACVFATQRTTASSIDVTTRSLVAWRLALAHPGDRHGSEALLGSGRYEAADISHGLRGLGYLTDGGPPRLVQVFSFDVGDVAQWLQPGLAQTLGELEAWDEVLLREHQM